MAEEEQEELDPQINITRYSRWFTGIVLILLSMGVFTLSRYLKLEIPHQADWLATFVLFLAGFVLVGYRKGVTLDREDKLAESWHSLYWVRFFRSEINLAKGGSIRFDAETIERKIDKERVDIRLYSIWVEGEDEDDFIELEEVEDDFVDAQQVAERYAKFMWVSLVDSTSGERVERVPESLDESLRDKAQRTGEFPDMPEPLKKATIVVTHPEEGTVVFDIPARLRFWRVARHTVSILLTGGAGGGAAYLYLTDTAGKTAILKPVWLVIMGIAGLMLLWTLLMIFKDATLREIITITTEEFKVKSKWALWGRTKTVQVAKLEELLVNTETGESQREFAGLRARTDAVQLDFGDFLDLDERQYLRDAVHHTIATL